EDYRGELQVLLINHGRDPFTVRHGERIAQLVVAPVTRVIVPQVLFLQKYRANHLYIFCGANILTKHQHLSL
ncbi:MAG: hypothetical protein AAF639_26635, partial [Chloroflexota bacterium]